MKSRVKSVSKMVYDLAWEFKKTKVQLDLKTMKLTRFLFGSWKGGVKPNTAQRANYYFVFGQKYRTN